MRKSVVCILALAGLLMLTPAGASADDLNWAICFQIFNEGGVSLGEMSVFGTSPLASDGFEGLDAVVPPETVGGSHILSDRPDLAGEGAAYLLRDIRSPIGGVKKHWSLVVASPLPSGNLEVRVWNPAGAQDIEGTFPIELYIMTPGVTPGPDLAAAYIQPWDPSLNGTAEDPAYSFGVLAGVPGFSFGIGAGPVPEPAAVVSLACGLVSLAALMRRRH